MKTYDEYTETVTRRRRTGIYCDRCGTEIPDINIGRVYRFEGVKVTKGISWPEGGTVRIWEIEDLCEKCSDKLRPVLEEFGITINEREVDF